MTQHTMSHANVPAQRGSTEKDVLVASKAFTASHHLHNSWALLSSVLCLAGVTTATVLTPWVPLRLALALLNGLLIVRVFCLFHDFHHGAIFRGSTLAKGFFWLFGACTLTPSSVWRETHNYHHAHTAKIIGSQIGSFPIVTTSMWAKMTRFQKTLYKLARHPINIILAVLTIFSIGMCLKPFLRAPGKHWGGVFSLLLVYGTGVWCMLTGHFGWFFFGWLTPLWLASMLGSYLFYAQHNFPGMHIDSRESWTFVSAAQNSSSYMVMGPIMNWMTANIGYHHVHHLNPAIPFYRLPEAMHAIPAMQHPHKTSLQPQDILACLQLDLWDSQHNAMVKYASIQGT